MRGFVLTLIKYLLLGYVGLVVILFVTQRSMLFHPAADPGPPAAHDLPQAQVVNVQTADGLTLKSWFVPPVAPVRTVMVIFIGNAGSLEQYTDVAHLLAQQGLGVLITAYRGYSGNPGAPTEAGLYADARANLQWVKAQGYDIAILGQSLGTGVAVQMATEFNIKALILQSPFTSIAATAQYQFPYIPAYWLVRDRFHSLRKIGQIKAPLLIIHGEMDALVPVFMGRTLFDAAPQPKQAAWLPLADHVNIYQHGAWPAMQAFLVSVGLSKP